MHGYQRKIILILFKHINVEIYRLLHTISQPNGTAILLQFLTMDMEDGAHGSCRFDYLEIRDGPTEESLVLDKLCGNGVPGHIQSNQSQVWMK